MVLHPRGTGRPGRGKGSRAQKSPREKATSLIVAQWQQCRATPPPGHHPAPPRSASNHPPIRATKATTTATRGHWEGWVALPNEVHTFIPPRGPPNSRTGHAWRPPPARPDHALQLSPARMMLVWKTWRPARGAVTRSGYGLIPMREQIRLRRCPLGRVMGSDFRRPTASAGGVATPVEEDHSAPTSVARPCAASRSRTAPVFVQQLRRGRTRQALAGTNCKIPSGDCSSIGATVGYAATSGGQRDTSASWSAGAAGVMTQGATQRVERGGLSLGDTVRTRYCASSIVLPLKSGCVTVLNVQTTCQKQT